MTWVPKNRATDGEDDESNGLGEENEKGNNSAPFSGHNYQPKIYQNCRSFDFCEFFPKEGSEDETSHGAPIVRLDDNPAVSAVQHLHTSDLLERQSPSR